MICPNCKMDHAYFHMDWHEGQWFVMCPCGYCSAGGETLEEAQKNWERDS